MRSIFTLLVIFLFAAFALKERFIGMLFYWWFAIFRPQDWMWWDVSSLRLPLIAAAIFVVPCLLQGYWPRFKDSIARVILIFLVLNLATHYINGCEYYGPKALEHIVKLIILTLMSERLLTSKSRVFWLVFVMAMSLGFHAARSGMDSLLAGGKVLYGFMRLTGTFSDSNMYALGTSMLLFFMVFILQVSASLIEKYKDQAQQKNATLANTGLIAGMFQRTLSYWWVALLIGIITLGSFYLVIAIFSRGSILSLSAGLLILIFLQRRPLKVMLFAIAISVVGLAVVPIPDGLTDRLASAFEEKEDLDTSAASRPHFWQVARDMVWDHPVGVGPGCYPAYYDNYDFSGGLYGSQRSVHSSHFQVLAELGYFGIFIWILLLFMVLVRLLKVRIYAKSKLDTDPDAYFYFHLANALICSHIVFVMGGSFYEFAQNELTWLIFIITIAITRLYLNPESEDTSKKNGKRIRR